MGVRRTVAGRPQAVHEARVERGGGEAGGGDEEQVAHLGRRDAGPRQRAPQRLLPELQPDPDEGVVPLAEPGQPGVGLERQRQVAGAHQGGLVDLPEPGLVEVLAGPGRLQGRGERLLVVAVGRQGAADGEDGR